MIKKLKALISENRENQAFIIRQNKELEWAHVYHDSIRGKAYLENLPLNIGRWAGNYPFFYLLNRIMSDAKPQHILEFGLGESSKFISSYLQQDLSSRTHQIIEHDINWANAFTNKFKLSEISKILICPLVIKKINNYDVNCYKGLTDVLRGTFDFYLIDGPFGSPHYSRYDITFMAERLSSSDDFIIVIDDFDRVGEKETCRALCALFQRKKIKTYTQVYSGLKEVWVLTSPKYRFLTSI
ncbi:hypothetical protein VS868_12615 [Salinimicrobium sp. 3283s]|uniref:hypothetical protein n=1 Tax=Salinimicrobium sp. 3283s TaxID=3114359 RepID=UPI0031E6CD1B